MWSKDSLSAAGEAAAAGTAGHPAVARTATVATVTEDAELNGRGAEECAAAAPPL